MEIDLVRSTIERYVVITDREWERIKICWSDRTFRKGDFVSRAGLVEDRFYIVRNGVQRLYIEHDGSGICLGFSYDHSWSGDYDSFIRQGPGRMNVQAVTDSVLVGIHRSDLLRLI